MLSPGQTIATCQRNKSQHCWAQHVACVWPPCCDMLRHVGCCWLKFGRFQTWANNTQHVATHRNMVAKRTQHVAPNNVGICCVGMLRSFGRGFTCIGDILVDLSTCHLSTCYVTWPKSKCYHNGLFYRRTRLLVIKFGVRSIRLGVSGSHSVRGKSTVLNVNGLILPEVTTERLISCNYPVNLETCNVHKLLQPCQVSNYHYLPFLPLIIWKIACFTVKQPLHSMSKDGMSKDKPRCCLCT